MVRGRWKMSDLYAIGYPNAQTAEEVLQQVTGLQAQNLIQLDDAVIVERAPDGKVKLRTPGGSNAARGAAGGALWGGLIGLIFFAPLVGMAIGAGTGAVAGKATDTGVNDEFMRSLGTQLAPGAAALVLLVRSMTQDKVLEQLHGQYGGSLLRSSLNKEQEQALQDAVRAAA
jgi:uncharacterized membrane protein